MSKLTVLVTGATGNQGGSVATALMARGHTVHALTRRPESPAAVRLAKAGARIATGDFAEEATVVAAAKGVDTVFLMGNSWEGGPDRERDLGHKAVAALVRARVGHVIYASVDSADRSTGVPHFESKAAVERHLAASGLPYTISAPVSFMDNLLEAWSIPSLQKGIFAAALPPARKLKKIAVADIGPFVAALAERRERVFGRRFRHCRRRPRRQPNRHHPVPRDRARYPLSGTAARRRAAAERRRRQHVCLVQRCRLRRRYRRAEARFPRGEVAQLRRLGAERRLERRAPAVARAGSRAGLNDRHFGTTV